MHKKAEKEDVEAIIVPKKDEVEWKKAENWKEA